MKGRERGRTRDGRTIGRLTGGRESRRRRLRRGGEEDERFADVDDAIGCRRGLNSMEIELGTCVECSAVGDGSMRALCDWTRATGKRRVRGQSDFNCCE